jgi:hypothetical protein
LLLYSINNTEDEMPIAWTIRQGEGVRIDGTDIWTVEQISDDGATVLIGPDGARVTLSGEQPYRLGPGFRIWLGPGAPKGSIRLVMEAYVPLMHRHPPRDHKAKPAQGRPA